MPQPLESSNDDQHHDHNHDQHDDHMIMVSISGGFVPVDLRDGG